MLEDYEDWRDVGEPLVLRDCREKKDKGWIYNPWEGVAGTEVAKLETADYTLKGLEHIVCIERKSGPLEIANNLFGRDAYGRFCRLLDRMDQIPHAVICCTFPREWLEVFPVGLPSAHQQQIAKQLRVDGDRIMKRLERLQREHPTVPWIFEFPNAARERALRFLLSAWNKYGADVDPSLFSPAPKGEAPKVEIPELVQV